MEKKLHHCKHCGKTEEEVKFSKNGNRLFFICLPCNREYRKKFARDPKRKRACELRRNKKISEERGLDTNRDKYILWDSRKWDRFTVCRMI